MTQSINSNLMLQEEINQLSNNIPKNKQIQIITKLYKEGLQGQKSLLNFLINRRIHNKNSLSFLDSFIFNKLNMTQIAEINQEINSVFPNGIVELKSDLTINYQPLQDLLIKQKFQEADKVTQIYLCELVGLKTKDNRKWLYFTDIHVLPINDLLIIDLLWRIYSLDKFGFSIQRQIWLSNNCNWEKFWETIEWTKKGNMLRYPIEFRWSTDAPKGHLPLFNQLRGIQVLLALFEHDAWKQLNNTSSIN
uniref:GUN4-like domain-containing protein n=1 Tax=Callithamnion tetricum TaxID=193179 RepID=A0A4D6WMT6_9FLOR|nr:hypothetical protein [Callithamnion tetricum]